jgi:outer membrane protein TolC
MLALALGGCANFSGNGGMSGVQELAGATLGQTVSKLDTAAKAQSAQDTVQRLLKGTLTADKAVRVALLNNHDLQAAYAGLGVAEAVKEGASLPPNPRLSLAYTGAAGAFEFERQVALDIVGLATLPVRSDIAQDRFRQAQLSAAAETLKLAYATRRAFYRAVAADAAAAFLTQSVSAADTASELTRRLGETGAVNKLDQARNLAFQAELGAQLGTARQRATNAREHLVRLMGLWGGDLAFRLPTALPRLPAHPRRLPAIEREAVARRVDLQIARLDVEALAKSYGLTRATRVVNVFDASAAAKTVRDPGGEAAHEYGGGAELEIPLFDFGEVRLREAEGTYMQAVHKLVAKAVRVRSEAREAYQTYRASYDIAQKYRGDVLPLRKIISDETLLRYNAMQIDVFTLLTEARERIASTMATIEAERNFWIADTDLGAVVVGGLGSDGEAETAAIAMPGSGATD